jgi:hypothetical protein
VRRARAVRAHLTAETFEDFLTLPAYELLLGRSMLVLATLVRHQHADWSSPPRRGPLS